MQRACLARPLSRPRSGWFMQPHRAPTGARLQRTTSDLRNYDSDSGWDTRLPSGSLSGSTVSARGKIRAIQSALLALAYHDRPSPTSSWRPGRCHCPPAVVAKWRSLAQVVTREESHISHAPPTSHINESKKAEAFSPTTISRHHRSQSKMTPWDSGPPRPSRFTIHSEGLFPETSIHHQNQNTLGLR